MLTVSSMQRSSVQVSCEQKQIVVHEGQEEAIR